MVVRARPPCATESILMYCIERFVAVYPLVIKEPYMNMQDQCSASHARIRAAVEDYVQGWYSGDQARTTRCLHPQLAKRLVKDDATIEELDATTLIGYVQKRVGAVPPATQQQEIEILGVYGNTASVRAEMNEWVDFLHLGCFNGEWKIVNVIWALKTVQEPT